MNQKKTSVIFLLIFVVTAMFGLMVAQAAPTISLSFYKNNGYGLGNDIGGQFTANAAVSQDVVRVEFYLDGQLVQNDTDKPFSWAFNTGDYSLGEHTIEVVAYDGANQTATVSATRNFTSYSSDSVLIIIVAVVIVVVVVGLAVAVYRIRKYNRQKNKSN
jgi:hypothetical protein